MSELKRGDWKLDAYITHNEALRDMQDKFLEERDRRYTEVKAAEEKALKLQAEKNEIHFDSLNHEQARLLADRERYLPRETYMADRRDKMAFWISCTSITIAALTFVAVLPIWTR